MRHFFIGLAVSVVALFAWQAYSDAEGSQEFILQAKAKVARMLNMDSSEFDDALFFLQKNDLLRRYEMVESEFTAKKAEVEAEYEQKKDAAGEGMDMEGELQEFQDKIQKYQDEFEAKKLEIEANIEDLKRRYEETKAAVNAIQDSVRKIQEGAIEGRDSLKKLKDAVSN